MFCQIMVLAATLYLFAFYLHVVYAVLEVSSIIIFNCQFSFLILYLWSLDLRTSLFALSVYIAIKILINLSTCLF